MGLLAVPGAAVGGQQARLKSHQALEQFPDPASFVNAT
jgi:hypothetical protein